MTENKTTIFWHRRDLRLQDNASLYQALLLSEKVYPVFIFDRNILDELPKNDQRVLFIYQECERLQQEYRRLGSELQVFYGNPLELIPLLAKELNATSVFANRDYEPYAIHRDRTLYEELKNKQINFSSFKDHVIFDHSEIVKSDGKPYTVFTPYSRKWKEKINPFYLKSYPVEKYLGNLAKNSNFTEIPSLNEMGFSSVQQVVFPNRKWHLPTIQTYHQNRDIPSLDATSHLSLHLRFGTVSIRQLTAMATNTNETFLNELIWRDFYQMILYHFPHSATQSFKAPYDNIRWENDNALFEHWCTGTTGYPLVDAGMRELNQTGFMHNRVRMVVASFLCKHLLIDWRWGETYFAEKLLDFDLASNLGGWQWASGSGCDAAPYFRVFNPTAQQEKFDPDFLYIKKWIPEFGTDAYPKPIIEHTFARNRAIERYKEGLKSWQD